MKIVISLQGLSPIKVKETLGILTASPSISNCFQIKMTDGSIIFEEKFSTSKECKLFDIEDLLNKRGIRFIKEN